MCVRRKVYCNVYVEDPGESCWNKIWVCVCNVMFVGCLLWFGVVGLLGGARQFLVRETPARLRFTNRRNKGLISVDRRTSLLSYLLL